MALFRIVLSSLYGLYGLDTLSVGSAYALPDLTTAKVERMNKKLSEVACFRQQQALRDEAAQRGLSGFAISATHESITARMQAGAERILRLIEEGKLEEALAILNTDDWCLEEQELPGNR